jgi:hypothetical protein
MTTIAGSPTEVRYITPSGGGHRDALGWADAGTVNDIPALLKELPPGGEVWARADMGPYSPAAPISIRGCNGVPELPSRVRGVLEDGTPSKAQLQGNRSWPAGSSNGNEVFRLLAGANNLAFSDFEFHSVGNGAFRIGADIANLSLEAMIATNVRRFVENSVSGNASSASVSGLLVRDVEVHGFSKGAIHLGYGSNGITLENVLGDSEGQDGDDYAIGVHLEGTVHNVVIRSTRMLNARDSLHSYWNGDGFCTEDRVYNVSFEDTYAAGNTDAGYDIKSSSTTMLRADSSDNKRNYRIWTRDLVATDSRGNAPLLRGGSGGQSQVWMAQGAKAGFVDCALVDDSPNTIVFDLGAGAELTFAGRYRHNAGARMARLAAGSRLTFAG